MNILVTGSNGFVGKNLVCALKNIKDGYDCTRPNLKIDEIFEFDCDTDIDLLDKFCSECDFVFNLAGVNRPKNTDEFMQGNADFVSILLNKLKFYNNFCPVMLASSIQASLIDKYSDSEYGKSKLEGEKKLLDYSKNNNVNVLIYRFTNLFGKWCRPNYNSVVATFCNNIANDLDIVVNDNSTQLTLCYIDDVVCELLDALEGKEHRCNYEGLNIKSDDNGDYCYVPQTYNVTLGEIVELLNLFKEQSKSLIIPEISDNSFSKKLYSTYLSYLPSKKIKFPLKMNIDERGSFTELLKTVSCGQFSVNISKPGVIKGQHWHNSKWEFFIVVSGKALIEERKVGTNEIISFVVSGEKIEAVHMLPGYTHNIKNLSDTDDLITLMWANEMFDSNHPDTYYMEV